MLVLAVAISSSLSTINTTIIIIQKKRIRLIMAQNAPLLAGSGEPLLVSSVRFMVTSQPQ